MRKSKISFSILWLLTGSVYLLFSGRAEGFFSIRLILMPVIVALLIVTIGSIGKALYTCVRKNYVDAKTEALYLLPKLFTMALIFSGYQIDSQRISETMRQGDALIQEIEAYKTKYGKYPHSIEADKFQIYKPALKNSKFFYSTKDQTQFLVGFSSVAWTICSKNNTSSDWVCED